ncbi:MAG: hypothetical protein K1X29_09055 [Bdellovibrionales bacterium]|nr:hypothetical protein [Bdellovibrionales bacterium]
MAPQWQNQFRGKFIFILFFVPLVSQAQNEPMRPPRTTPPQDRKESRTLNPPGFNVSGLKPVRNNANNSIQLTGRIPQNCRDKISIQLTCSTENNVVFSINELSENGLKCLSDFQNNCRDENASREKCVSLEELAKDKKYKNNFSIKLDINSKEENCNSIEIQSAKVTLQKNNLNSTPNKPEGTLCVTCQQQTDSVAKLQEEVRNLRITLEKQQEKLSRGPDPSNNSQGERNRNLSRGSLTRRASPEEDEEDSEEGIRTRARPMANRGMNSPLDLSAMGNFSGTLYGGYGNNEISGGGIFNSFPMYGASAMNSTLPLLNRYGSSSFPMRTMGNIYNQYPNSPNNFYTSGSYFPFYRSPSSRPSLISSPFHYGGSLSLNLPNFRYGFTGYGR